MLFREIIAVYCETRKKRINTLCVDSMQSFFLIIEEVVYIVTTWFKGVKRFSLQRKRDPELCWCELVFVQTVYQRR
jgi:hypothetical protein